MEGKPKYMAILELLVMLWVAGVITFAVIRGLI